MVSFRLQKLGFLWFHSFMSLLWALIWRNPLANPMYLCTNTSVECKWKAITYSWIKVDWWITQEDDGWANRPMVSSTYEWLWTRVAEKYSSVFCLTFLQSFKSSFFIISKIKWVHHRIDSNLVIQRITQITKGVETSYRPCHSSILSGS